MPNTLITRDVINKNIKYTGCYGNNDSDKLYDYDDLCREIDRFKNILLHNNAQKGQTVYNFLRGTRSTSLFFAAAELGLITCITDVTKSSRKLFFENDEYIDAKTRSVMPIDFVFEDKEVGKSEKRKMYSSIKSKITRLS